MRQAYRRQHYLMLLTLLALAGFAALFVRQGIMAWGASSKSDSLAQHAAQVDGGNYLYYTVKQSSGFVLARAAKGSDGQPLSMPQPIAQFGNEFGQAESDAIFSMQLSPDSHYLAIDGSSDHGEQVWIFNIQQRQLTLTPANVMGNFLHWLPGVSSHTFLYRPMFPLGPNAPQDSNGWNPGLWVVDAATSAISNIGIQMSSAFLVDAISSPDGSHIVYSTSKGLGLGSDTWIMSRDGSQTTHLFAIPGGARSIAGMFAWSPDGTKIAYERLSDSPTPFLPAGLWLMNTNGMQQRYLADTDGGHGFALTWSPDSRRIAYVLRTNVGDRSANFSAQSLQSAIAVVDTSTGHSWTVASQAQTGKQISNNPVWTAGGNKLTFTAYNPFNLALGGAPRYWSAQVGDQPSQPLVIPLTSSLLRIVAIGS
jgi:Tol biopolymer transport system component